MFEHKLSIGMRPRPRSILRIDVEQHCIVRRITNGRVLGELLVSKELSSRGVNDMHLSTL